MKKHIALFLIALLLPVAAFATDLEIDLSNMSFDQLVALREQVNLAIWNSQEWQEVTVPEGIYKIGIDIPVGHWSIRVASKVDYFYISYFDKIDDIGKGPARGAQYYSEEIASPGYSKLTNYNDIVDFDLQDGWFLKIGGQAIFTPYTGKPDLDFK